MWCSGRETREGKRESRRQAILAAAHDLFVEKGYEATTLSDVVRRSGGSLATLYEMFENKPGLMRALVAERCNLMTATIDRAIVSHSPPREALREISEHMYEKILDPETTALFKAALTQPELGRQLYEAGPVVGQAKVAEYLALLSEEGVLEIDDPLQASQMLFQMMFGHFHHRLMFGMPVELSADQKEEHFERVLAAFFRVYGPCKCSTARVACESSIAG